MRLVGLPCRYESQTRNDRTSFFIFPSGDPPLNVLLRKILFIQRQVNHCFQQIEGAPRWRAPMECQLPCRLIWKSILTIP